MKRSFGLTTLAFACYFSLPGLIYSVFTSRLPALKVQAVLSESLIGLALLAFGASGVLGLLISSRIISRFGSKRAVAFGALAGSLAMICAGFAQSPAAALIFISVAGFGFGIIDVASNAQGVTFEITYNARRMNLFHAFYSLGAISGSLFASFCAWAGISVALNFVLSIIPVCSACLFLTPNLLEDVVQEKPSNQEAPKSGGFFSIPLFVLLCGIGGLLAYTAEGSVAEWGPLFMTQVKGISPATAALVYAVFSTVVFTVRLAGDKIRDKIGNYAFIFIGACTAFAGQIIIFASDSPAGVLFGYAVIGAGMSPIFPTIMSLASAQGLMPIASSAAVVTTFSYAGLLIVPPMIGWLAEHLSLSAALMPVFGLFALIALLAVVLRKLSGRPKSASDGAHAKHKKFCRALNCCKALRSLLPLKFRNS